MPLELISDPLIFRKLAFGPRGSPEPAADGTTLAGHLLTTAHSLATVGALLAQAEVECGRADPNVHALNGLAFVVATGLLAVLESLTHYCQRKEPLGELPEGAKIYFGSYDFRTASFQFIRGARARIEAPRFRGMSFVALATYLKHHSPWVAPVARNGEGSHDLWDGGAGFVYGMLAPAYKEACTTIRTLARHEGLPEPRMPQL